MAKYRKPRPTQSTICIFDGTRRVVFDFASRDYRAELHIDGRWQVVAYADDAMTAETMMDSEYRARVLLAARVAA